MNKSAAAVSAALVISAAATLSGCGTSRAMAQAYAHDDLESGRVHCHALTDAQLTGRDEYSWRLRSLCDRLNEADIASNERAGRMNAAIFGAMLDSVPDKRIRHYEVNGRKYRVETEYRTNRYYRKARPGSRIWTDSHKTTIEKE